MAYQFYVSIKGTKQGKFKGESIPARKHDPAVGFNFQVEAPLDSATGHATGKRQFGPIQVKGSGMASPQIFQSVATNESFATIQIDFVTANANGSEAIHYTVHLNNATISRYTQFQGRISTLVFAYDEIQTFGHAPHPSFITQWGRPSAIGDWKP